ncbi:nucleotide-binding protein [Patescibacteria group bacterium]|nr:nucleotide-binding protein [Patescibacteria group bacterium]MBU0964609.1 nucleotide-binding protein [Patescibacteria group bacterium]
MTSNKKTNLDSLRIKRDALLDKKRIIDNIDKLIQRNPSGSGLIKTNLNFLTSNLPSIEWDTLNGILDQLKLDKIAAIIIHKTATSWGEYDAEVYINKDFVPRANKIRDQYHKLNDILNQTRPDIKESSDGNAKTKSKKVFIVHGHDNELKEATARLIQQLSLKPIILHEQPNKGNTLIEKLESNSVDIGYSIVLLTPDDKITVQQGTDEYRTRQNVILELGYFFGKLGRKNVCAIYKKNVKLPSDFQGIVYIPFDDQGAWQYQLAKELKAAGLNIDMNKLA